MSEQRNITVEAATLEVAPGFKHDKIEGWIPELAAEEELRHALEKAFDYRGDVTITRKDGNHVEGYIFDRRKGETLADSVVRLIPQRLAREDYDCVLRHRGARLQRSRYRRGQELGSVGEEVLGAESGGREEHRDTGGSAGISVSEISSVTRELYHCEASDG